VFKKVVSRGEKNLQQKGLRGNLREKPQKKGKSHKFKERKKGLYGAHDGKREGLDAGKLQAGSTGRRLGG